MRKVVIVGGNRELGTALIRQYHVAGKSIRPTTFTSRHPEEKHDIVWITKVDMTKDNAGAQINRCWDEETKIDVLIICTGSFVEDTISTLNRSDAIESFNIGALGPVPLIHTLRRKELLKKGSKVVIVNEAGAEASITLKHESGERGNYGACASRAALNMVVKLLSIDLKEDEIPVAVVHTGWLRRDTHVSPWFKESSKFILLNFHPCPTI